ncbi:MAG: CRTAC1 family protein [Acidobacteriota bacterium]
MTAPPEGPFFEERSAEAGLDFRHFNGMSGARYYSEMMGSGVALFDADGDGDLDVYAVQGRMLPVDADPAGATPPPEEGQLPLVDRLYLNELIPGGQLQFTDVTQAAGLQSGGYGMGVAAGDVDNDGDLDLYVTNDGPNQLWRNDGGPVRGVPTFTDVTAEAGADDPRWSVSAAFVDFDRDGWLDLFVVNYVDFSTASAKPCRSLTGTLDYCGPLSHPPVADRLLRNRGDGTFEDVTAELGIDRAPAAAGLGVVTLDADGDGWLDLFVANDGMPNHLWVRGADGVFSERALLSGASVNQEGQAEAGMGVVAGDVDGDGDEDLLLTHLALESNTFYRNDGHGSFEDRSVNSGLGAPSWSQTGFGNAWIDVDNDGWLDLLTVNGGVKIIPEQLAAGDPLPLKMPTQLFRNLGPPGDDGPRFEEVASDVAGADFATPYVGRGVASGDVDNDGDSDVLVSNNGGTLRLLVNRVGQDRHWLGVRPVGKGGGDRLGAWVGLEVPSGTLWRRSRTDGSYASSNDPRLRFGLGDTDAAGPLWVRWPDGSWESFDLGDIDRYVVLREGSGRSMPAGPGGQGPGES